MLTQTHHSAEAKAFRFMEWIEIIDVPIHLKSLQVMSIFTCLLPICKKQNPLFFSITCFKLRFHLCASVLTSDLIEANMFSQSTISMQGSICMEGNVAMQGSWSLQNETADVPKHLFPQS